MSTESKHDKIEEEFVECKQEIDILNNKINNKRESKDSDINHLYNIYCGHQWYDDDESEYSELLKYRNGAGENMRFYVDSTLSGHKGKVYTFEISRDNEQIISFGQDGVLIVWDIHTKTKQSAVKLESKFISNASYCNYNTNTHKTLVACGGLDTLCYIYDLTNISGLISNAKNSNCLISTLQGHDAYISGIQFVSNYQILTSSGDKTCKLWDIVKSKVIHSFESDTTSDVTSIDIIHKNGNDNQFISGSVDGYARLFDLRLKTFVTKFGCNNVEINTVKCFKNNTSFVIGSEGGNILFYDLRSYQQLNYYGLHDDNDTILDAISLKNINGVSCIDFSKSGAFMFNIFEYKEPNTTIGRGQYGQYITNKSSKINNCIVRHTITKKKIDNLHCESPTTWLKVANNGKFIVTSHINQTIKIWKSYINNTEKNQCSCF